MHNASILEAYIFALAILMGFQLISKVPSVIHTPLMSATNAIHGIVLVGGLVVLGTAQGTAAEVIGTLAVFLGTMNVVGGYVVTDRMLGMFKTGGRKKAAEGADNKAGEGA